MQEEVKWQFAEDYYKYLIKVLSRIDQYMVFEVYEYALKELSNIFSQLSYSIKYHLKEERHDKIKAIMAEIEASVIRLKVLKADKMMSHVRVRQQIEITEEIKGKTQELYSEIMTAIDEMNMLFPRQKRDRDQPIYQQ